MKLIDKDALVAEIIRRRKAIPKDEDDTRLQAVYGNESFVLTQLLEYINTLEVKDLPIWEKVSPDTGQTTLYKDEGKSYLERFGYRIDLKDLDKLPKKNLKAMKGEWLCENEPNNYARFIQILEIVNIQGKERYRISRDIHNDEDIVEFDFVEKYYHKFDIQDAKDGDVLVVDNVIFIYKRTLASHIVSYCKLINDTFEPDEDARTCCEGNTYIHPTTKEQRDILFQKMKETGYKWDAEKKELKKIEQNPAWSEEDERMFNSALWHVKNSCGNGGKNSGEFEVYNWLKSIKNRYSWKPSDEQMQVLDEVLRNPHLSTDEYNGLIALKEQLKAQKGE